MKIFVWKSYGDITVYDISTGEKYSAVLKLVKESFVDFGQDLSECKTIFDCIWKAVGKVGEHESVEFGTCITTLK